MQKDLLDPAIKGTVNVLTAAKEAGVRRVVVTSSVSAIIPSPSWPGDVPKREDCWADVEFCKQKGVRKGFIFFIFCFFFLYVLVCEVFVCATVVVSIVEDFGGESSLGICKGEWVGCCCSESWHCDGSNYFTQA